jgi:hypothetical protein
MASPISRSEKGFIKNRQMPMAWAPFAFNQEGEIMHSKGVIHKTLLFPVLVINLGHSGSFVRPDDVNSVSGI